MKFIGRRQVTSVLGVGTVLLGASAAKAQTATFATFTQSDGANEFAKIGNQLVSSMNGTAQTSIPVNFHFNVANGYDITGGNDIAGTLLLSATFTGNVSTGSGNTATQHLAAFSAVFTANTPGADGSTNLLTISSSTGTFTGDGGSGGENSSTAGGDTINFSSAALDFTGTTQRNFADAFTSIDPPFSGAAAVTSNTIPNFTAFGQGSFASTGQLASTAAPEPGAVFLMSSGLLGIMGYARRRSRRTFPA